MSRSPEAPARPAYEFTIRQPPISANRYWRHTKTGRVYVSAEAEAWRDAVGWAAKEAGVRVIEGAVKLAIEYHFRHLRRLDVSNVIKILEDGLKGVAFLDDKQVTRLEATAIQDKADPRVIVRIGSDE